MPKTPEGHKRPADVVSNAVRLMKIATGEIEEAPTNEGKNATAVAAVLYNFTKIQKTLRTTPAMAAGLTDRVWGKADVVALIEQGEALVPAAQAD